MESLRALTWFSTSFMLTVTVLLVWEYAVPEWFKMLARLPAMLAGLLP